MKRLGRSLVAILLKARGPSAIVRTVVAVVIDAVQCRVVRPWPHITEERFEAVAPLVADRDSATTVVLERCEPWIETAALHRRPRVVLGRMAAAVRSQSCAGGLNSKATTGASYSGPNIRIAANDYSPAVALAPPVSLMSIEMWQSVKKLQASKLVTNEHARGACHLAILQQISLNTANAV